MQIVVDFILDVVEITYDRLGASFAAEDDELVFDRNYARTCSYYIKLHQ